MVGARDIDPPEQRLFDDGTVALVPAGPRVAEELGAAVGGRPVYLHVDCDVLAPGLVPTDYRVPDGLSWAQLQACADVLAAGETVGVEIGELEIERPERAPVGDPHQPARDLICALQPVLAQLGAPS